MSGKDKMMTITMFVYGKYEIFGIVAIKAGNKTEGVLNETLSIDPQRFKEMITKGVSEPSDRLGFTTDIL